MTETEAPTPAQLASLKTEGLSRLYRVVPRWGAKGMVGTMVLGPHLAGAVIGAVGPACSVGAARFYQTAMFSAYGAVLVPGRGAIPIRARLSLKALCHPILRPRSSSFPPVSLRLRCAALFKCWCGFLHLASFIGVVAIKYVVKRGRPLLDPVVRRVPRHLPQLRWMLRVADR